MKIKYKVTILTDNKNSWILKYVDRLKNIISPIFKINHIFDLKKIKKGDILLILGCERILSKKYLKFNNHNIVVHPSDLPKGKGFSPLAWQILEGKNVIKVCLFEANEKVDSGDIYFKENLILKGHELNDEIKDLQGKITINLVLKFLKSYPNVKGKSQKGKETFYKRRTEKDLELNINKSIKSQFNLLRISDNLRYPAFFKINGKEYIIKIYEK